MSESMIIRLKQSHAIDLGCIRRINGLMPAKEIIRLIDILDLEANPRNSRLGNVTRDIQESIESDDFTGQNLFPLKSKGILIGASDYEPLERHRFKLTFNDLAVEGILDGGHNTLAIGVYILEQAFKAAGEKMPRKRDYAIWETFKSVWNENRDIIDSYLEAIRDNPEELQEEGISLLHFLVPVELLVPVSEDEAVLQEFKNSLLDICAARNNNAQLTESTKANREGLFASFKQILTKKHQNVADRVNWKTNEGKDVDVKDVIALCWIPLSKTEIVSGPNAKIDAPSPTSLYSGKARCMDKYIELMRDNDVTVEGSGSIREVKNPNVVSALEIAADLPSLFDSIYQEFPKIYNEGGGSYGRISAVKSKQNAAGNYEAPFSGSKAEQPVPDGFIYPIIWGLRALIGQRKVGDYTELFWKVDPEDFIKSEQFRDMAKDSTGNIAQQNYDPQKVGKGAYGYTSSEKSMRLALLDYMESRGL